MRASHLIGAFRVCLACNSLEFAACAPAKGVIYAVPPVLSATSWQPCSHPTKHRHPCAHNVRFAAAKAVEATHQILKSIVAAAITEVPELQRFVNLKSEIIAHAAVTLDRYAASTAAHWVYAQSARGSCFFLLYWGFESHPRIRCAALCLQQADFLPRTVGHSPSCALHHRLKESSEGTVRTLVDMEGSYLSANFFREIVAAESFSYDPSRPKPQFVTLAGEQLLGVPATWNSCGVSTVVFTGVGHKVAKMTKARSILPLPTPAGEILLEKRYDGMSAADAHLQRISDHVSAYLQIVRSQLLATVPKGVVHCLVVPAKDTLLAELQVGTAAAAHLFQLHLQSALQGWCFALQLYLLGSICELAYSYMWCALADTAGGDCWKRGGSPPSAAE